MEGAMAAADRGGGGPTSLPPVAREELNSALDTHGEDFNAPEAAHKLVYSVCAFPLCVAVT